MIIVSDTSPLNYLVLVHAIDVLPRLFERVYVPTAVINELSHARAPAVVRRWVSSIPPWLHVQRPSLILPAAADLGAGEAGALALAKELNVTTLLIDEKKGRRVAREQGFTPVGTLAVLEFAASLGHVDLPSTLFALKQTSFQITQTLIDDALMRHAARMKH
ncbi:MAG TPA: DUF3368 domain-containing protein [Phycisphaerae bacterium]|nr:DUF3368 domain-containing protein [Phycisphaerae bacterium]